MAKKRLDRRFQGTSVKKQNGSESHFVSNLDPVNSVETGESLDRAGVFRRDSLPDGSTKATLVADFTGNEEETAEMQADAALLTYLGEGKKKSKEKDETKDA